MRNVGDVWVLENSDGNEVEMVVIAVDEENMICQSIQR